MKLLISNDALIRHSRSIPAHAGYTQNTMDWRQKLGEYAGKWVNVETKFLFEDQFNIVEGNLRIDATLCDDIDFEEIAGEDHPKFIITEDDLFFGEVPEPNSQVHPLFKDIINNSFKI